ncbi:MAG: nucleotidyltransferase family protein [Candidatus Omnitrophica bacterium]|nr:nucleotidyltransferase family protein [Candidatus Omnitrophota bacterium]
MKSVILAAGRGTRMRHLTDNQPKPMIDIGKELILEKIVFSIRDAGISEFVVVTGYHANIIENFFGDGHSFGIQITYVRQKVLDGTAGAVRITRDCVNDKPFLLSFGDIITNPANYSRVIETFHRNPSDALLSVNEIEDPYKGAAVHFDPETKRITQIIEKPPKGSSTTKWNNSGIFVFTPSLFDYIEQIELSPRGEYELPDAIRLMIEDNKSVMAMPLKGFWGDIGTPEDVEQLRFMIEKDENILQNDTQNRTLH